MAKKMKLRGCPFCGSPAHWCKGDKKTRMNDRVQCLECFAEIEGDHKPMSALSVWNTRVMDHYTTGDRQVNIEGENL